MSESCAYEGWVRHRRREPVAHELRVPIFMLYLDLDELPEVLDGYRFGLASARGRALARFRRADHLGDPARPLADEVRALVAQRTGTAPAGAVRTLTMPRQLGMAFSPVSFHYCFAAGRAVVEAIVAEVSNTPWGERYAYVLSPDAPPPPDGVLRGRIEKAFHVSPFMGMDYTYAWRLTAPGARLIAHIDSEREGRVAFDATLSLRRVELTPAALRGLLTRHPLQTPRVLATIYAHGLRVWLKGARYVPHPHGTSAIGPGRGDRVRASRERAGR